jgi:hypothetical protein
MNIKVERKNWSDTIDVYVVEGVYKGVPFTGLTDKKSIAEKVIQGGWGSKVAAKILARDLRLQHSCK